MALLCLLALLLATGSARADIDCSPAGINAAREAFRAQYQAKDYAGARDILVPFANCFGDDPQGALAAAALSDLAIAAYHVGDGEACAEALAPYAPTAKDYRRRLARLPRAARGGILFNLHRCVAGCPMVAPTCQSIAAALALQRRAKGNFSATQCPFAAGGPAVAFPRGGDTCLTILPPLREVPWGERADADPDRVCPRLALTRREGGAVRVNEIALPTGSWLRDLELCCAKPVIGVARNGRFAIEPEDNPPEGCLSGHRTYIVEEVYALDHGRLRLRHKLRQGVY
jgi:hypothetical protein